MCMKKHTCQWSLILLESFVVPGKSTTTSSSVSGIAMGKETELDPMIVH